MQQVFKALIAFVLVTTLALSSFSSPVSASPSTPFLAFGGIPAFVKPNTVKKAERIILRVTPKVAKILTKKYARDIVKVVPIAGTTLTAIELAYDIGSEIQAAIQADIERDSAESA